MDYKSKFTMAEDLDPHAVKIAKVFAWSFASNLFMLFSPIRH